ncbi:GPI-anchored cell wall beta-1,3-endoglucanase [Blumeria hordei DH14]|uniref:glucan endo-1,3-beta-D-glucosidase n=1 Tax=Blumeria graminis f. sp. hordei (strain DH14) TaxID=546991 RepID=N1J744_BLUG1|nr:GPI-anchored cell wall beta-1,3-endoglucanase [Blumeria hordei DH14]
MDATRNAAKGKPLWITETGWPVGGPKSGAAETGSTNAKSYWDQVGCPNFGTVNTWWYTLDDTDGSTSPGEQFGVVKGETPNFDLSCSKRASDLDSGATSASSPGSNGSDVTNGTIISPSTGNGTRSSPSSGLTPDKGSGGRPTGTAGLQPTGTSGAQPSGGAGFKPNNSVIDIGTPSATTTGNLGTETQNAAALVSGSMMGVVGALVFGLVM